MDLSITKKLALDTEMVGCGYDGEFEYDMLARVSIVNEYRQCIYDRFVKPTERVTNYREDITGITPKDLKHGRSFNLVKSDVNSLIQGKILIGHSLDHDLQVLDLRHPYVNIRDTAKYAPFKRINGGKTPSLKWLAKVILNEDIQEGAHSSVEDAKVTMAIYQSVANQWETKLRRRN